MALPALLWSSLGAVAAGASYKLQTSYVGENFFSEDNWDFFTAPDPTTGAVQYVDKATAEAQKLINATADKVYVGADLTSVLNPGEGRKSVRLESKTIWPSGGLFIIDVEHVPTGCGVWPAWWLLGIDAEHPWPTWGEIDIIEDAHGVPRVYTTLHTDQNCDQSSVKQGTDFTAAWNTVSTTGAPATNCSIHAVDQDNNQGCSVAGQDGSLGTVFNQNGGGTFALHWSPTQGHISAFLFKEGSVPADVKGKAPKPETWGTPYAFFKIGTDACPANLFKNLHMILNTDFCGQ